VPEPPGEGIGRGVFWVGAGLVFNEMLHRLAGPQPIYQMDKSVGGDLRLVVYGGTRARGRRARMLISTARVPTANSRS
jgi:hypothetical protein